MLIAKDLEKICEFLAAGKLIAYPTETQWAIGADIGNPKAIAQLLELKPRAKDKPLSLLVADPRMASEYAYITDKDRQLMELFWPGPLTLILPAKESVPEAVRGGGKTIGLRCSSHPLAKKMVRMFQKPISTTSANRSGQPQAHSKRDMVWAPADLLLIIDDDTDLVKNPASTVLEKQGSAYRMIREGQIEAELLRRYIDLIEL